MKVLLVSNMYANAGQWDKLDALGKQVELAVVTPTSWRLAEGQPLTRVPAAPATAPWKHYALDTLFQFKDNPVRYFYVPRQLARVLDEFKPDLVVVSAGFDAHERDPLASLRLTESDFAWATQQLMETADRHSQGRLVSVLEGGYDLQGLSQSVAAHVKTLMRG